MGRDSAVRYNPEMIDFGGFDVVFWFIASDRQGKACFQEVTIGLWFGRGRHFLITSPRSRDVSKVLCPKRHSYTCHAREALPWVFG